MLCVVNHNLYRILYSGFKKQMLNFFTLSVFLVAASVAQGAVEKPEERPFYDFNSYPKVQLIERALFGNTKEQQKAKEILRVREPLEVEDEKLLQNLEESVSAFEKDTPKETALYAAIERTILAEPPLHTLVEIKLMELALNEPGNTVGKNLARAALARSMALKDDKSAFPSKLPHALTKGIVNSQNTPSIRYRALKELEYLHLSLHLDPDSKLTIMEEVLSSPTDSSVDDYFIRENIGKILTQKRSSGRSDFMFFHVEQILAGDTPLTGGELVKSMKEGQKTAIGMFEELFSSLLTTPESNELPLFPKEMEHLPAEALASKSHIRQAMAIAILANVSHLQIPVMQKILSDKKSQAAFSKGITTYHQYRGSFQTKFIEYALSTALQKEDRERIRNFLNETEKIESVPFILRALDLEMLKDSFKQPENKLASNGQNIETQETKIMAARLLSEFRPEKASLDIWKIALQDPLPAVQQTAKDSLEKIKSLYPEMRFPLRVIEAKVRAKACLASFFRRE